MCVYLELIYTNINTSNLFIYLSSFSNFSQIREYVKKTCNFYIKEIKAS